MNEAVEARGSTSAPASACRCGLRRRDRGTPEAEAAHGVAATGLDHEGLLAARPTRRYEALRRGQGAYRAGRQAATGTLALAAFIAGARYGLWGGSASTDRRRFLGNRGAASVDLALAAACFDRLARHHNRKPPLALSLAAGCSFGMGGLSLPAACHPLAGDRLGSCLPSPARDFSAGLFSATFQRGFSATSVGVLQTRNGIPLAASLLPWSRPARERVPAFCLGTTGPATTLVALAGGAVVRLWRPLGLGSRRPWGCSRDLGRRLFWSVCQPEPGVSPRTGAREPAVGQGVDLDAPFALASAVPAAAAVLGAESPEPGWRFRQHPARCRGVHPNWPNPRRQRLRGLARRHALSRAGHRSSARTINRAEGRGRA